MQHMIGRSVGTARAIFLTTVMAAMPTVLLGACGGGKEANGSKPTSLAGGKAQTPPAEKGANSQDAALCPEDEVGLCLCVEGGFELEGEVWDFACCEDVGLLGLYSCGDDATCNADTFACESL